VNSGLLSPFRHHGRSLVEPARWTLRIRTIGCTGSPSNRDPAAELQLSEGPATVALRPGEQRPHRLQRPEPRSPPPHGSAPRSGGGTECVEFRLRLLDDVLLENGTEDEKASAGDHRHGVHPARASAWGGRTSRDRSPCNSGVQPLTRLAPLREPERRAPLSRTFHTDRGSPPGEPRS
jgi:hypothetical protein